MEKLPADLKKALTATPGASALWKDLTPIARRDFVTWIESAKQETTRMRRIAKACDMLLHGKRRPCCYAVVPLGLYRALSEDPGAKARWKELTPDERRDFSDWVDAADASGREKRIADACRKIAAGKKHP